MYNVDGDQVQSLEQPADDVMDLAAGKHYLLLQGRSARSKITSHSALLRR